MSKIALTPNASGTGVFTISSPATNTDRTLTLPDEAGTVLTSASSIPTSVLTGNITQNAGPAFSAYKTSIQSFSSSAWTKVVFDNELYDTNGNYDPTTNYRFTPDVEGYYIINLTIQVASGPSRLISSVAKNGSYGDNRIFDMTVSFTSTVMLSGSKLLFMNGTTDYVEAYVWASTGSPIFGFNDGPSFNGFLVRAA
jgi:hypothetical protein